jgi:uncharacterized delta-60 repeat protein
MRSLISQFISGKSLFVTFAHRSFLNLLAMVAIGLPYEHFGQGYPGTIDTTFDPGTGVDPNVFLADGVQWIDNIAVDRNGNVLVAGRFHSFNGVPRSGIARLHSDGSLDQAFNPGAELDGRVITIVPLETGKILLGGGFTKFGTESRANLVRLNSDGSLDPEFTAPLISAQPYYDFGVHAIAFQSDGRMVVAGSFFLPPAFSPGSAYLGTARLNPDGSLDTSFAPLRMAWYAEQFEYVNSLVILDDQRIIYAGVFDPFFNPFTSNPIGGLGRLNQDGTKDLSFGLPDASFYSAGIVLSQSGGMGTNLLVTVGKAGTNRKSIIRLTTDGLWEESFQPSEEVSRPVFPVRPAVQQDSKILVRWNDGIARLNPDGSLDTAFEVTAQLGSWPGLSDVRAIALQSDGRILAAGRFDTFQGGPRGSIVRLFGGDPPPAPPSVLINPTNQTVNAGQTVNISVRASSYMTPDYQWLFDGKPLLGATNSSLILRNVHPQSAGTYALVVTNPKGTVTTSNATLTILYSPTPGSLDLDYLPDEKALGSVNTLAVLSYGKLLVAGTYKSANGYTNQLIRLNSDGSFDSTFKLDSEFVRDRMDVSDRSMLVQPDGRILISDYPANWQATPRYLARFEPDGALDASFNPGPGLVGRLPQRVLAVQPDGKIIIEAYVTSTNLRSALIRLNQDGSPDDSFSKNTPNYSILVSFASLVDGKMLIFGFVPSSGVTGTEPRFDRLNLDGTVDNTFRPNLMPKCCIYIYAIAPQTDGRIVVSGPFSSFDGHPRDGLVRLNMDGSVDESFNPDLPPNPRIHLISLQPDGNIVITVNNVENAFLPAASPTQVIWLDRNGKQHSEYAAQFDWQVNALAVLPDSKLILGGSFTNVNGVPRPKLARLLGETVSQPPRLFAIHRSAGQFVIAVQTLAGRNHHLEFKDSLIDTNWISLLAFPGDGVLRALTDDSATVARRFYRVRVE